MRVLLLGGTGFLGGHLAAKLQSVGYSTVTASSSPKADIATDLSKTGTLERVINAAQAQVVLNLAGTGLPNSKGDIDTQLMWQINSRLPARTLQFLIQKQRRVHFIHIASALEAVPDESTYALTKRQGSQNLMLCMRRNPSNNVRATIASLHNLYGPCQPRERFVSDTIQRAREGRRILIHHPHRRRDFVYVEDAVEALVSIIQAPPGAPTTQIVGTGKMTAVAEVARQIVELMGSDPKLVSVKEYPSPIVEPESSPYFAGFHQYLCQTSLQEGLLHTLRCL